MKKEDGQAANTGQKGIHVELIPDTENGGFTALVPGVPAYGEGDTEEEAIVDLKEGLALFVEEFGLQETMDRILGVERVYFVDWNLEDL